MGDVCGVDIDGHLGTGRYGWTPPGSMGTICVV
jgi:hypothetical protein